MPTLAGETNKRGGTLNYVVPADGSPSFHAHRETTYATIHSAAPFYSPLIGVNPPNPGSRMDFVCDLCIEIPKPKENGKTDEVTATGDYEAAFHLKRPRSALIALLTSGDVPIYPCHVSPTDMRLHPIGTGQA
jgi:hypothetical protein